MCRQQIMFYFFFNDTATTEIYTLSLHDALPILLHKPTHLVQHSARITRENILVLHCLQLQKLRRKCMLFLHSLLLKRSEEHTSELQSRQYLVCRLLLEKKKTNTLHTTHYYLNTH